MFPMQNAKDLGLTRQGSLPDLGPALGGLFQTMTFKIISKNNVAGWVAEDAPETTFHGVFQKFTTRELLMKPEGQRAWPWYWIHSTTNLNLNPDDQLVYLGKTYRVKGVDDSALYGYMAYSVILDYTGVTPP